MAHWGVLGRSWAALGRSWVAPGRSLRVLLGTGGSLWALLMTFKKLVVGLQVPKPSTRNLINEMHSTITIFYLSPSLYLSSSFSLVISSFLHVFPSFSLLLSWPRVGAPRTHAASLLFACVRGRSRRRRRWAVRGCESLVGLVRRRWAAGCLLLLVGHVGPQIDGQGVGRRGAYKETNFV